MKPLSGAFLGALLGPSMGALLGLSSGTLQSHEGLL